MLIKCYSKCIKKYKISSAFVYISLYQTPISHIWLNRITTNNILVIYFPHTLQSPLPCTATGKGWSLCVQVVQLKNDNFHTPELVELNTRLDNTEPDFCRFKQSKISPCMDVADALNHALGTSEISIPASPNHMPGCSPKRPRTPTARQAMTITARREWDGTAESRLNMNTVFPCMGLSV